MRTLKMIRADYDSFPPVMKLSLVEDAIARVLSRTHRVIPNEQLRALRRYVLAGHLPNVSAQCAAPPPPAWPTEV